MCTGEGRAGVSEKRRGGEVLHWLLEGKSMRRIGLHMGLSDRHIGRIKDTVVRKMSQMSDRSDV
ncbi:hypothetical protein MKY41_08390 [Sporosarcina sp. FSL W7-1349]|uniref:hypothetical protein n=1 Tax=Sporosarcina sp. FSL W7-1349 TaxID=2921561 RepID=UPI0030F94ADF